MFDIEFVCHDPTAYRDEHSVTVPSGGSVTFDVGGLSDWLIDGETGLFARAENGLTRVAQARTPVALARALDAMADPGRLSAMSAHALATVARLFDPDKFMKDLLEW